MKFKFILLSMLLIVGSVTAFASNDNDGKNEGTKVELVSTVQPIVNIDLSKPAFNFELNNEVISIVQEACGAWYATGETRCNPITGIQEQEFRRLCVGGAPTMWGWYEYEWRSMPS